MEAVFLDKKGILHRGNTINNLDNIRVIHCVTCGFKHIIPLPEDKVYEKFYEEEFYQLEKKEYFKDIERDVEYLSLLYDIYYRLIERLSNGRKGKLLEIGSGPGLFLKVGFNRGWKVLGLEPSKLACDYAEKKFGVTVINAFFSKKYIRKHEKFDVVVLLNVLEHLPYPIDTLLEIKEILNDNGLIVILVPNDYNPFQQILYEHLSFKPWWISPKHHVNYFDFKTLEALLVRLGFKIELKLATFPIDFFLLAGKNYVTNKQLGKEAHKMRKTFEINLCKYKPELLLSLYQKLSEIEIGRQIFMIARKSQ